MVRTKRKLQVFVSSTYTDLIHERQAAVSAILKAGHIPAGMELFAAGDQSQWETIKRWIDASDVYMLLLGGRYGSVDSVSGVSYTEMEYDYAVAEKKPLFAIVISDPALEAKVKSQGLSVLEKEEPKALALFRKKVLSNISSFFSDEKDIRLGVYESLSEYVDKPEIKGWVFGGDIEDTSVLKRRLQELEQENQQLKEGASRQDDALPLAGGKNDNFDEIIDILGAIEVKIPEKLKVDGKPEAFTLLSVLKAAKDTLINGVTNSAGMGDVSRFYYFNVFPKLIVHDLAENVSVPGGNLRRSSLNKRGLSLLARIDRGEYVTR